ncbi:MAG: hypothetical protein VX246_11765 [Myxococcota bacterium]|nr:hypothetical protein [Myxococcota bacterium]
MPVVPPNPPKQPDSAAPQVAKANRFESYRLAILLPLPLLIVIGIDLTAGALLLERHIRLPNGDYHHGFEPLESNVETWGTQDAQYFTNSLAMRDASRRQVPLESDRHRILVLGDSFAEGVGLAYEESVPGLLDALFPEIEVLNAAVVSHSPRLEYFRLLHLADVVGLDFDEVVVFIDISDVQDEFLYRHFEPHKIPRGAWFTYRLRSILRQWSYVAFSMLSGQVGGGAAHFDEGVFPEMQQSYRLTKLARFWERRPTWSTLGTQIPKWARAGQAALIESLGRIAERCERDGLPLTLVAYPWPMQLGRDKLSGPHIDPIREFAVARGLPLVDLYPVFEEAGSLGQVRNRYFFRDDVHWNAEGSGLVANAVARKLPNLSR